MVTLPHSDHLNSPSACSRLFAFPTCDYLSYSKPHWLQVEEGDRTHARLYPGSLSGPHQDPSLTEGRPWCLPKVHQSALGTGSC